MFDEELNTFIAKFKQLWQAGVEAHLAVDSHAGKAWVHLHVPPGQALGPLPHPVQPHSQPTRRNRNTPSRQRRRVRRAAAREQGEGETVAETNSTDDKEAEAETVEETNCTDNQEASLAEEASMEPVDKTTTDAVAVEVTAEVTNFECYFCDLDCVDEKNLENHWYEKHKDALYSSESEQSEKEIDEYHCENCNSKFKNAGQLRRHRKSNHR